MVLGGGEASGPLYPPVAIDETMFSCEVFWRYGTFWRNLFAHVKKTPRFSKGTFLLKHDLESICLE